jgi:biopolymer transport protein ExbB
MRSFLHSKLERLLKLLLCGWLSLTLLPGTAHAWWNNEWTVRKEFTVDASASGVPINR